MRCLGGSEAARQKGIVMIFCLTLFWILVVRTCHFVGWMAVRIQRYPKTLPLVRQDGDTALPLFSGCHSFRGGRLDFVCIAC